ncbi:neutral/alkaline non-lysosomal ceramidase N-terminal domain-containing protein [bacterium]|nr:neutral/alkaline non-lysosomal ceramidase N-terminal domain-containing protein [bacterium]
MGQLKVAYGEVDITPHFPVDLAGYGARVNPCIGILDPIFATFMLYETNERKALLVGFDLLAIGKKIKEKILSALGKIGFSPDEIFLFGTHTHSAPSTGGVSYMGEEYEQWLEDVVDSLVYPLRKAISEAKACELRAGGGEVNIALNRRTIEGWLPQKKEVGYVEKEFAFLSVDNIPFLNFTCHAVCLTEKNRFISADFPGRARIYLKSFLETPLVLLANGAAGDQNPIEREIYGVEKTGRTLAEASYSAMEKMERVNGKILRYAHQMVAFPLAQPPSIAELEEFIALQRKGLEEAPLPEQNIRRGYIRWAEDTIEKIKKGNYEKQVIGKVSLLRIGEIAILFLPGEIFSEIGAKAREILRDKGFLPFIVGYYDELVGYIPTASAFEEGGYEVSDAYKWYGKPAPFLPTVEDILLESVKELVEKI